MYKISREYHREIESILVYIFYVTKSQTKLWLFARTSEKKLKISSSKPTQEMEKTMPLKLLFVSLRQWHRLWMDQQPNDLYFFFQFFQKSCLSFVFFRMSRSKDTNWDPTKNKDGGQVIKKSFLYATIFWKLRVISR